MARVNVYDEDGKLGWFDPDKAERFNEATRWDGQNNVSAVAPRYHHEALYRTKGGRWVLNHWSQWQGSEETYRFVTDEQAKTWLLKCEHDDAVKRYFGEIEEERGPGRPAVGPMVNVRLGEDLTARVDAARLEGESRAAAIRRLLEDALS
jgi:hypothetical protein